MKTFTPDSSIASDVIPSPNYGDRNKGRLADMILLHYTGMPDVEGAIAQLCTPGTDVSAHYIVLEDGRIVQCDGRVPSRILSECVQRAPPIFKCVESAENVQRIINAFLTLSAVTK